MSDLDMVWLLAGRVMGWLVVECDGGLDWDERQLTRFPAYVSHPQGGHYLCTGRLESRPWNPQEKIADAWMLVEALTANPPAIPDLARDDGPWFTLDAPCPTLMHDCAGRTSWTAGWRRYVQYEGESFIPGWHACAPTACRAICAAALLAVTERKES